MPTPQELLNTLAAISQSLEETQKKLSRVQGNDRHAAVTQAWSHLAKAPQRQGLDPMTNARCNALSQANTQSESDALTQAANAMLHIHDHIAGVRWYSLPGTRREVRSESLRLHENAENRALLSKLIEALSGIAGSVAASSQQRPLPFSFYNN
jgi:uncharacterized alpha-E superfamily protein